MNKKLYYNLLLSVMAYFIATGVGSADIPLPSHDADILIPGGMTPGVNTNNTDLPVMGRLPGARIVNYQTIDNKKIPLGNCDPKAEPLLDEKKANNYEKSCIGQGITRDNFLVKVSFWPRQPLTDTDNGGNPWIARTVAHPGAPTIPRSYTNNGGIITYNADTCGDKSVDCTNITQMYDFVNKPILDDKGQPVLSGPLFTIGDVDLPLLYNNNFVYGPPSIQKNPASGNVQTELLDKDGNQVTTKCMDEKTGQLVQSSTQPTETSLKCSTGVPITDSNGVLISTPLPVSIDLVYSKTVNPAPQPTSPSTQISDNLASCTSGTTEQYLKGKYIRDKDCSLKKDLNRCGGVESSKCNFYLVGGGDLYDVDGKPLYASGEQILAVSGAAVYNQIPGSLFTIVFDDFPESVQSGIMSLGEVTEELSVSDVAAPLLGTDSTLVNFSLRYEGNQVCVYAYGKDVTYAWLVEGEYPKTLNEVYGKKVYDTDENGKSVPMCYSQDDPRALTDPKTCSGVPPAVPPVNYSLSAKLHCVEAPPPVVNNTPLSWNSIISQVCTQYSTSGAAFKKPFTSVAVECIEDTMLNLFYPVQGKSTFFTNTQERLKNAIRALMALYIIFFGYKLLIGKEVPKRTEWTWLALKLSLVIYFAMGSGMTDLLTRMLTVSKGLSIMVMQSGMGVIDDDRISLAQAEAANARIKADRLKKEYDDTVKQNNITENKLADLKKQIENFTTTLSNIANARNLSMANRDSIKLLLDKAAAELAEFNATRESAITNLANAIQAAKSKFVSDNKSKEYNTSGTSKYNVPSFCKALNVEMWGGGAAGKTVKNSYAAGGAGRYIKGKVIVSAGQSRAVYVGGGGSSNGASGMGSYFENSTLVAGAGIGIKGSGSASECNTVAGGNPHGGSGQPASACAQGGDTKLKTSPGGGGCSASFACKNATWGIGTAGKAVVVCTNFDFSDMNNINNSDSAQATFANNLKTDIEQLQNLQNNIPQNIVDQKALVENLEEQYSAAITQYNKDQGYYDAIFTALANMKVEQTSLLMKDEEAAKNDAETAEANAEQRENALNALNDIAHSGDSTGYSYCDFRMHSYPEGKEYIQLWDMIDCKFSKYLGIGDNANLPDAPQVLLVMILAPFSAGLGIPIFFCALIFTTITIMIIVRVVHIYIMAFITLLLLVYISPLVIPACLFQFTNAIFTNWMKQLIAFWLQPVILFAFLSFMFAVTDHVMFGGNHSFSSNNKVMLNGVEVTPENNCDTWRTCDEPVYIGKIDRYAPGYIYQILEVKKDGWPIRSFDLIQLWSIDFGENTAKYFLIGLVKLLLISFVVYSVLKIVEGMSSALVAGMSAAALSNAPVFSPAAIMSGVNRGVSGVKDAGAKVLSAGDSLAKAYKQGGGAGVRRTLLDNKIGRFANRVGKALNGAASLGKSVVESSNAASVKAGAEKFKQRQRGDEQRQKAKEAPGHAHKIMRDDANK